jgi:hypothetical protein
MVSCFSLNAQHRNDNWVFGDSVGVNFTTPQNPVNFISSVNSRGTSACISDTLGSLLFYYAYDHKGSLGINPFKNGNVYNSSNAIMENGDSIVTGAWYMEGLIIPKPDNSKKYYLFHIGVTGNFGLYYSTIDLSYNNGLGKVTSKNNQLLPDPANDGLTAVKHGNGRDWWLIHRKCRLCNGGGPPENTFYKYLITPAGIQGPFIQNIGTSISPGTIRYVFNADGSQLADVQFGGLTELFDFDRCTGLLSNYQLIRSNNTSPPNDAFFSCEFSLSGQYLYIATNGYQAPSYLIQVDLQNPLGYAAADTVAALTTIPNAGGMLRRAPNNKIYWSCIYDNGFNFNYPYADTMYNMYNMNLSVINTPDSPGISCNFTPYSFYLGGARTYWGLPNNPNYDLPRLQGSSCDTVLWTGISAQEAVGKGQLFVTYISNWQKLFVNAQHLKGTNCLLKVYDITGKKVFELDKQTVRAGYYTFDLDCNTFATGMYIVKLQTEKEMLTTKFIKN